MNIINYEQRSFYIFMASCVFNPLFWNTVARLEYYNKFLTKTIGCGSPLRACYCLALTIFSLGIIRDYLFKIAIEEQPTLTFLNSWPMMALSIGIVAFGNILVLSSMYKLGITGTYLGDYFGILMKERVITFPFNIMRDPMYNGSTMIFFGTALFYGKPAGLLLSAFVYLVYQIALRFESPFTEMIYLQRSNNSKKRS